MAKRATKTAALAGNAIRVHLSDVKLAHFARLASGIVRVAAVISGRPFVRHYDAELCCTDAPLTGPFEMDAATPVLEVIEPQVTYADRGEVKDPVAA